MTLLAIYSVGGGSESSWIPIRDVSARCYVTNFQFELISVINSISH